MVKRKASKKVKIKKRVKRNSKKITKKATSISRKDFEAFQFGVQRLKELREELSSLDTRDFPVEAAEIRVKLKNVSEIPVIERKLKQIKDKIRGKYKPPRRKRYSHKKLDETAKRVDKISVELDKLHSQLDYSKPHVSVLSKKVNELNKEIPGHLSNLGSQIKDLKKQLLSVEKEVDKIHAISLNKKVRVLDEEVPEIKTDIKKLNSKTERLSKKISDEVDLKRDLDLSFGGKDPGDKIVKELERDLKKRKF